MARLATHVWVGAYLGRLAGAGVFAHIIHRGDPTAGAIAVKVAFMNGRASLWSRTYGLEGGLGWGVEIADAPEAEIDAAIARAHARDRDLWVIEVEDPRGRHLLEDPTLSG
ncbi:MAG: DUF1491 family protein [Thermohalobaculum sp.]|nr:DUF1491 family protein [Thermohalobaculum sp.]